MPIQILQDKVIAQIAAGEVIERPASVVKELIENALDAGASSIHISVSGGGRRKMQITDNGHGIPTSEAELAFARHATSKLSSADDLSYIRTLGFRGEALASIASVSRTTLKTRFRDEEAGTHLQLEAGQVVHRQSIGLPAGTTITVENLFYNTPARLKFLKAENTEKRHIALVVTRYAMAYPQVRFVLEQDGRESFRSAGNGQLSDVLVAGLGVDTFRDMIEIDREATPGGPIRVYGYTSMPSLNRADRSRITLFVNGRWVQDSSLSYAVVQAYHTFLMKGRFPVAVILIDLPSEEVDVNVHPTKAEVRFQKPNDVFAAVQRTVRRVIIDYAQAPAIDNQRGFTSTSEQTQPDHETQRDLGLDLDSPGWYPHQYQKQHNDPHDDADPTAVPSGLGTPRKPRTLPMLRVIGQVGGSYIVAEGPAGLYLIDQHAAHERILYEQFMENHARQESMAQLTLSAQTIELPPPEAELIESNLEIMQSVGFHLDLFGTNTFVIRSIPAMLADTDPIDAIHAVINELEAGFGPGETSIEEKLIQRVCKQAAVKAGTILSIEEMQGLIRQLERTDSPHTCPHGRPTMLHMTSDHPRQGVWPKVGHCPLNWAERRSRNAAIPSWPSCVVAANAPASASRAMPVPSVFMTCLASCTAIGAFCAI